MQDVPLPRDEAELLDVPSEIRRHRLSMRLVCFRFRPRQKSAVPRRSFDSVSSVLLALRDVHFLDVEHWHLCACTLRHSKESYPQLCKGLGIWMDLEWFGHV